MGSSLSGIQSELGQELALEVDDADVGSGGEEEHSRAVVATTHAEWRSTPLAHTPSPTHRQVAGHGSHLSRVEHRAHGGLFLVIPLAQHPGSTRRRRASWPAESLRPGDLDEGFEIVQGDRRTPDRDAA